MISHAQPPSGPRPWRPSHRTPMAGLVWRTFAADRICGWRDGKIVWPAPDSEDVPYFPEMPPWHGEGPAPDWIAALLARLDDLLPSSDDIMGLLDPDSLTIGAEPAAFRMPSQPCSADAGACVAAARILLACADDLVMPVFIDPQQGLARIAYASYIALMLGGESAFLTATEVLSDPGTYTLNPVHADGSLIIVVEDEDRN